MVVNFSTIAPGGGGDYTSINAWDVATDGDLVTDQRTEIGMLSGTLSTSVEQGFSASTTSEEYYRALTPFSGLKHTGTSGTGGATVRLTADRTACTIEENFGKCSGIEFDCNNRGANGFGIRIGLFNSASGCIVDSCLIYNNGDQGIKITVDDCHVIIRNNVIWDMRFDAISLLANTERAAWEMENNTIHDCNNGNETFGGGISIRRPRANYPNTIHNNISTQNLQNDYFSLNDFNNISMSGNVGSDATTPGVSNIDNIVPSSIFTSYTGVYDLSLVETASIIGSGVTISDFDYDVVGTSRPQGDAWEPGAFEFEPAGGGESSIQNIIFIGSINLKIDVNSVCGKISF